jgi:hypothetical protein
MQLSQKQIKKKRKRMNPFLFQVKREPEKTKFVKDAVHLESLAYSYSCYFTATKQIKK